MNLFDILDNVYSIATTLLQYCYNIAVIRDGIVIVDVGINVVILFYS
jgi:hypothetical protein